MTSHERFNQWFASLGHWHAFGYDDCWIVWQAAEAQTAKRCAEIARGIMHMNRTSEDNYDDLIEGKYLAAKEVAYAIKDAFPEAFTSPTPPRA
jgi:hypothetical protein